MNVNEEGGDILLFVTIFLGIGYVSFLALRASYGKDLDSGDYLMIVLWPAVTFYRIYLLALRRVSSRGEIKEGEYPPYKPESSEIAGGTAFPLRSTRLDSGVVAPCCKAGSTSLRQQRVGKELFAELRRRVFSLLVRRGRYPKVAASYHTTAYGSSLHSLTCYTSQIQCWMSMRKVLRTSMSTKDIGAGDPTPSFVRCRIYMPASVDPMLLTLVRKVMRGWYKGRSFEGLPFLFLGYLFPADAVSWELLPA